MWRATLRVGRTKQNEAFPFYRGLNNLAGLHYVTEGLGVIFSAYLGNFERDSRLIEVSGR